MTRKTINPAALYQVTLASHAAMPNGDLLPARPEPYEMRGRLLKRIAADRVASFELAPVQDEAA